MSSELLASKNQEYVHWLSTLKKDIAHTQIKASIAVNEQMLRLYWRIGRDITTKQFDNKYGSRFYDNLSRDLKVEFPDVQGFSARNIRYMKRFYEFYSPILHQPGAEFKGLLE
ncbi:hypothetical protein IJJ08_01425 [bacterium]|nr:hypothetical protein [bacterium]